MTQYPLPMFIVAFTEMGRGNAAAAVEAGRRALAADPSFAAGLLEALGMTAFATLASSAHPGDGAGGGPVTFLFEQAATAWERPLLRPWRRISI